MLENAARRVACVAMFALNSAGFAVVFSHGRPFFPWRVGLCFGVIRERANRSSDSGW